MSGTSLDGLDIAYCVFEQPAGAWKWQILQAETIPYSPQWKAHLEKVYQASARDYMQTHADFGTYMGDAVNNFIQKHGIDKEKILAIASHGHTIFHEPTKGFTTQIGCGAHISAGTGLRTVCDFRSLDVALGGQGAPLVPIGDKFLFSGYDAFLNLGGFANISFQRQDKHLAFDICPVNFVLNSLCSSLGKEYDKNGKEAEKGLINNTVLQKLNGLDFYLQKHQKSLGREWVEEHIFPVLQKMDIPQDALATFVEHIVEQIHQVIEKNKLKSILVTGGGVFNTFLMKQLKAKTQAQIQTPDPLLVNYKEALIFAFLGLLRLYNQANTLSSVTGASKDSVGGAIYG